MKSSTEGLQGVTSLCFCVFAVAFPLLLGIVSLYQAPVLRAPFPVAGPQLGLNFQSSMKSGL